MRFGPVRGRRHGREAGIGALARVKEETERSTAKKVEAVSMSTARQGDPTRGKGGAAPKMRRTSDGGARALAPVRCNRSKGDASFGSGEVQSVRGGRGLWLQRGAIGQRFCRRWSWLVVAEVRHWVVLEALRSSAGDIEGPALVALRVRRRSSNRGRLARRVLGLAVM